MVQVVPIYGFLYQKGLKILYKEYLDPYRQVFKFCLFGGPSRKIDGHVSLSVAVQMVFVAGYRATDPNP